MSPAPMIETHPSPNHGERAAGKPTDMLLLHYTGMASAERALRWLCDPESGVSCHYFIFEDGRIAQLVDEDRRAWHAGVSTWAGESDINSRSIGIEIVNPGHQFGYRAFPEEQIDAVIRLSQDILARWAIPPERVLAHSDVAPMRKEDPGELFPWQRLNQHGIGHWQTPAPLVDGVAHARGDHAPGLFKLQQRFRDYGYGIGQESDFGAETEAVVRAFQRHFRQERVDGIADASTIATLDRVLDSLGRSA
jgi:N-acetylmuramoyl-L-alanine amidase